MRVRCVSLLLALLVVTVHGQTVPSGALTRLSGQSGNPWLFLNSQALGDPTPTHHQYSKFGGGFVMKAGPGDYRAYAEGVAWGKTLDPANQPGAYDNDTASVYGTSTDGANWTWRDTNSDGSYDYVISVLSPTNPAGGSKAWMHGESTLDTVIYDSDAGLWKGWGHAGNNTGPRAIFYATSVDGVTGWTFQNNGQPVMQRGSSGTWDDRMIADVRVIRLASYDYRMYYRGWRASDGKSQIGYATSVDGVTWTKYAGNPVLTTGPSGAWDSTNVMNGPFVWDGVTVHTWYAGQASTWGAGGLGYASSTNWTTFTKGPSNPVLVANTASASLEKDGIADWAQGYDDGNQMVVIYQGHNMTPPLPLVGPFRGSLRAAIPYAFTYTAPNPCASDPFRLTVTRPVDPTATWAPGLDSRGCLPVTQ